MWLDDVIGVFAPMAAFRRKQARNATSLMERAYEGAKVGRRTDGWSTTSTSANSEIAGSGNRLRDRARDITRNNPYGRKAKRVFADNFIGKGITPEPTEKKTRLGIQISAAWDEFATNCDAEGDLDFCGIEGLVVRTVFESGECFVRFRDRPASDGLHIPFQLQVLEPDYLDTTRNTELANGYNLGGGALQRSTLRRKLNRGDYELVPAEFLKWVWAGGRKLKGLVVRRQAEAIMFSA